MLLGGLQKNSLIDYPGKISCVLFVSGCNFHCPYCHNPDLASGTVIPPDYLTEDWFFDFLKQRKTFLEGVVISGGEPTLQTDLASFCRKIKKLEYPVKIDTNGSDPRMIAHLLEAEVIDYLAMDIKTDPNGYTPFITGALSPEDILSSIRIIMASRIDYEFRTTYVKPFMDESVLEKILDHTAGRITICMENTHNLPQVFLQTMTSLAQDRGLRFAWDIGYTDILPSDARARMLKFFSDNSRYVKVFHLHDINDTGGHRALGTGRLKVAPYMDIINTIKADVILEIFPEKSLLDSILYINELAPKLKTMP